MVVSWPKQQLWKLMVRSAEIYLLVYRHITSYLRVCEGVV